jgi:uncharacterized membrane protein YesL
MWESPGYIYLTGTKCMFSRIFAKFFWDAYDYLGRFIIGNIIFSFILVILTGVSLTVFYPFYNALNDSTVFFALASGLFISVMIPFPAAAFLYFLAAISEEREPEFRDFITGVKKHYWPLFRLTASFIILFELLAVNIVFYINPELIAPSLKIFTAIISGLCLWIFLYLSIMMLYAYPMSVHQGAGLKKIFIRSFLLVMDNIGATILSLILLFCIWGLAFISKGIMVFVLNFALTASLANSLYVNVMEKYEIQEEEKKAREEEKKRPSSWKDIKTEDFIEDRHKRYKRTLKDILKPWEY